MDVVLWIVLLSGLLSLTGIWFYMTYTGYHHIRRWQAKLAPWLVVPFGIAFIVSGFISLILYPSRSVGRTTCRHFAEQSGYPTKFVILNWADTGTCLARTPDGHWTKNTNIIVNIPSKP